jgi:hypothetical protein
MMVDTTASTDPEQLIARLSQMGFPLVCAQGSFLEYPWDLIRGIVGFDAIGTR